MCAIWINIHTACQGTPQESHFRSTELQEAATRLVSLELVLNHYDYHYTTRRFKCHWNEDFTLRVTRLIQPWKLPRRIGSGSPSDEGYFRLLHCILFDQTKLDLKWDQTNQLLKQLLFFLRSCNQMPAACRCWLFTQIYKDCYSVLHKVIRIMPLWPFVISYLSEQIYNIFENKLVWMGALYVLFWVQIWTSNMY